MYQNRADASESTVKHILFTTRKIWQVEYGETISVLPKRTITEADASESTVKDIIFNTKKFLQVQYGATPKLYSLEQYTGNHYEEIKITTKN